MEHVAASAAWPREAVARGKGMTIADRIRGEVPWSRDVPPCPLCGGEHYKVKCTNFRQGFPALSPYPRAGK